MILKVSVEQLKELALRGARLSGGWINDADIIESFDMLARDVPVPNSNEVFQVQDVAAIPADVVAGYNAYEWDTHTPNIRETLKAVQRRILEDSNNTKPTDRLVIPTSEANFKWALMMGYIDADGNVLDAVDTVMVNATEPQDVPLAKQPADESAFERQTQPYFSAFSGGGTFIPEEVGCGVKVFARDPESFPINSYCKLVPVDDDDCDEPHFIEEK